MRNSGIEREQLARAEIQRAVRRMKSDPASKNIYEDACLCLVFIPSAGRSHAYQHNPELRVFEQHLRLVA